MTDARSLLDRILAGESPELLRLAAQGLLPVAPEELLPVQVALATGADRELAGEAAQALGRVEPRLAVNFLERVADERSLAYFARHIAKPMIIAAVIRRRDVPRSLLIEIAPTLAPDLQEALLLRQDAIVEEPAILDGLADNPGLSTYARRRIGEYREHLIPGVRAGRKIEEPGWEPQPGEATEEEVHAALAAVRLRADDEGELDEISGLTEGQIRLLPVPVRLRLARGATRQLRQMLVRDPNAQVAVSVLRMNSVADQEVEQIAGSRVANDEVFEEIARRRDWIGKYQIARAMAFNPGVPVAISLRLVGRLSVRDLRFLSRDRNVAEPIRAAAARLYRIKRL